jgi:benzodiazapine receptor
MVVYWIPIACVVGAAILTSMGGLVKKCEYRVKEQPPGWVFSIVWPVLFILLGFAGQEIWKTGSVSMKIAFILLLLTLIAWPLLQWGLCSPTLGVITIVLALTFTLCLAIGGVVLNTWIAVLLLPLLAWLSYATALDVQTLYL